MVGEYRSGRFSGFLYGVTMLFVLSVNCSNSASYLKKNLQQISNKNSEMLNDAKTLFHKSFTEHRISESECNETLEWFSISNISNMKSIENLLKELDRNMNLFQNVFKQLKENYHTEELTHSNMIPQAVLSIEAQRKNIQTYLNRENGANETGPALPEKDLYERKKTCCSLLNVYLKFLKAVRKELWKHTQKRKKRDKARLVY